MECKAEVGGQKSDDRRRMTDDSEGGREAVEVRR